MNSGWQEKVGFWIVSGIIGIAIALISAGVQEEPEKVMTGAFPNVEGLKGLCKLRV